jgi:deazaflavin-dependent oxidoreductase (nitroreductase family)
VAESELTIGEELAGWGKVALLETRGRRSGQPVRTAVGFVEDEGGALLVAAGDPDADWALNLLADPACRVTVGERDVEHVAETVDDPQRRAAAVRDLILKYGTPAERLGRGPVFRLVPVAHRTPPRSGCLERAAVAMLALLVLYVAGLLFVAPVQTATRTALLLPELIELPIRPLSAITPTPVRSTTTYGQPADRLDIYLPGGAPARRALPAVVLALGVHPQPLDSPDVVRIASSIARLGVVVGVPDSASLRETRIQPTEPAHLADAVLVLLARPEVDESRVGLAGFSAGASIALIAAADPRIAERLRFVSAFGGYADAKSLLIDVATRTTFLDGEIVEWPADAGITRDVRQLYLNASGDPAATDALFAAQSRLAARAVIEDQTPQLEPELAAISPLNFADQVRSDVFLLHGDGDNAISVGHAIALSEALGERVVKFTRFGSFGHGQPGEAGLGLEDAGDIWQLAVYLHEIVAVATE